ncbi:MAG: hypothetical protein V1776_01635 [Candidatus Diapherotrites archaeon]
MSNMEKGQVFSADVLLAVIVFTLILTLVSSLLHETQLTGENERQQLRLSKAAGDAIEQLLSDAGSPVNWEQLDDENVIHTLGLIDPHGTISVEKWSALQDWNRTHYAFVQRWLGIPDMNYHIRITNLSQELIEEAGISPFDVNNVGSVILPSIYNGNIVFVQVQVHQNG